MRYKSSYLGHLTHEHGLKVVFHIEPYNGRTAESIKADIQWIYANYGAHPAFHQQVRSTKWGTSRMAREIV
ncbi:unnamed protein product [Rotaria sp. Silwood2]|nr:unnamed protein product [Rotaria sp. Silwood2]CAF4424265.1 unnamed protein product [Rotaria sp. Silwood2]